MMRFPRKRDGSDPGERMWLWRLAADAARTALAVVRVLVWLWREGNDAGGR